MEELFVLLYLVLNDNISMEQRAAELREVTGGGDVMVDQKGIPREDRAFKSTPRMFRSPSPKE
jgi:hypothetical protein